MKAKVFGQHDEATIKQIETCIDSGGERGVLCADGHKGYAQPIGGVVAYKNKISLSGVGFDIACGNLAILTDAKREQVAPRIKSIMDDVVREISFGIGQKQNARRTRIVRRSGVANKTNRRFKIGGGGTTRHRGRRKSLCGSFRGRAGADLGGRAFRLARART